MDKEITEYDDKGNCIHFKNFNDYETWKEYDKRNNIKYYRRKNIWNTYYEEWTEFDDKNKEISYQDTRYCLIKEYYKYDKEEQIEITKEEFDKTKERAFLNRKIIHRYEILDI